MGKPIDPIFKRTDRGIERQSPNYWPEHIHVSDELVDEVRNGSDIAAVGEGVFEIRTINAGTAFYRFRELGPYRIWEADLFEVIAS